MTIDMSANEAIDRKANDLRLMLEGCYFTVVHFIRVSACLPDRWLQDLESRPRPGPSMLHQIVLGVFVLQHAAETSAGSQRKIKKTKKKTKTG